MADIVEDLIKKRKDDDTCALALGTLYDEYESYLGKIFKEI